MKCASLLQLVRCPCAMLLALGLAATTSAIGGESSPPAPQRTAFAFHVKMPKGASIGAQHLYQEILGALLFLGTQQAPGMKSCEWEAGPMREFGVFSVRVRHPDPGRRVSCLRAAVHLILLQTFSESDFLSARRRAAELVARSYEPNPRIFPFDGYGLVQAALRTVYQNGSPLHQIYSARSNEVREISFDEFELWLRRSREDRLIDFAGERGLLEALGLPVPDPMVLRIVPSLESPRLPAGLHSFEEGERFGVPAIILLKSYSGGLDQEISRRLSCNLTGSVQLGEGSVGNAISSILCDTYPALNNEHWAVFFVDKKAKDASDRDFCLQVQALIRDPDIATAVHFSPEGTKGLYILLPPWCVTL